MTCHCPAGTQTVGNHGPESDTVCQLSRLGASHLSDVKDRFMAHFWRKRRFVDTFQPPFDRSTCESDLCGSLSAAASQPTGFMPYCFAFERVSLRLYGMRVSASSLSARTCRKVRNGLEHLWTQLVRQLAEPHQSVYVFVEKVTTTSNPSSRIGQRSPHRSWPATKTD